MSVGVITPGAKGSPHSRAAAIVEPDPFELEQIVVRRLHAWEVEG